MEDALCFKKLSSNMSHDDIRRSLEILDNVLAEFDDCIDTWDLPQPHPQLSLRKFPSQALVSSDKGLHRNSSEDAFYNQNNSTDGSFFVNSNDAEQTKISSPPPIPRRNPTTRLSEFNPNTFSFLDTPNHSPTLSERCSPGNGDLSRFLRDHEVQMIRPPLSAFKKHDDNFNSTENDCCSNCGRQIRHPSSMESLEDSPSLFQQRKRVFETKIAETSSSSASQSPCHGSPSFRIVRRRDPQDNPASRSFESGIDNDSESFDEPPSGKSTFLIGGVRKISVTPPNGLFHDPDCPCREKIRLLTERFSETKRLLKLNKIKGLDSDPPSFVPPPPPVSGHATSNGYLIKITDSSSSGVVNGSPSDDRIHSFRADSLRDIGISSFQGLKAPQNGFVQDTSAKDTMASKWTGSLDSLRLCSRCSDHLSETIEDIPKLLPTDALNRPYLGLSYSLEEDLSPGVKELHRAVATSTPKSDKSSPGRVKAESGLSTFSQSSSSLGYVSSQSDLELNHLPSLVPNKVPVSTFRSRTLPNGLDRSPFYSPADELHPSSANQGHAEVSLPDGRVEGVSSEGEQRSSSAPPPPEVEKPKIRHFRIFSRKSKKDKHKSGNIP